MTGEGKDVGPDRLTDKQVARLVKRAAMAAGVRADLPEGEREEKFAGHSLRAHLGRGRRALRPKAAPARFGRNDARLPTATRPPSRQSHEGSRVVNRVALGRDSDPPVACNSADVSIEADFIDTLS